MTDALYVIYPPNNSSKPVPTKKTLLNLLASLKIEYIAILATLEFKESR